MSIYYTSNNTFIFCYVRMNPPTPGHLTLIGEMFHKAIDLGSEKIFIITSTSLDSKNPVPCNKYTIPKPKTKADNSIILSLTQSQDLIYKSSVLHDMINSYKKELIEKEINEEKKTKLENVGFKIICSQGNPFGTINKIIQIDFIDKGIAKINLYFFVGRDRANFLDTIMKNFKDKDYINSVDGDVLGREGMGTLKETGMGERSITDIRPSEYSASFIRNLVRNNQKADFQQVYNKYLNTEEIEKLYETIKIGMELKQPPSSYEDENPPTEFFEDEMDSEKPGYYKKKNILPIINTTTGGKKHINNNRKTKKNNRKTKKNNRKTKKNNRKTKKNNRKTKKNNRKTRSNIKYNK